ncbi:hypothetical protein NPIL_235501 [Nephila pilipes]|uniref:Uncharacterized protein n=1 Tax=Nephila pilipes TaxID=299642 RepID=A0A8X6TXT1_NEPPI|nr:hypothetical protein NPIL_235501 [Nephila pilipes]
MQNLQPILSYVCAIWGNTNQTNINKLQIHQNRDFRLITGAPVFIPRRILHDELNIETIPQLIRKLAIAFYNSLEDHEKPTINSFKIYYPNRNQKTTGILTIHPLDFLTFECKTH